MKQAKRSKENEALIPDGPLDPAAAVAAVKKFKGPKFDQSVELCMHMGLDTKQADQNIRGSVSLPNGIGKTKRVVAFCTEDNVQACLDAGAIKAGGEQLVAEITKGWMEFDVVVSSPDMMRVISKLGRVLGPKGLMPSPKAGTVAPNVAGAVKEYSAGKLEYRADKGGNVHAVIGKMSFSDGDIVENLKHFVGMIEKVRPSTVKGQYIKSITLSGTMTPGVKVRYASAD